jgi:acyl dehydratase
MAMGQKFFEDFVLGETFDIPSKTLTDSHFLLFAAVTGDSQPIHYDREYCRMRGYPERLAHGFLVTVQTVLGASSLRAHTPVLRYCKATPHSACRGLGTTI